MPRLRTLYSEFSVRGAIEIRSSDGVGPDLGLALLPSLEEIHVWLDSECANNEEEAKELKATLWHTSKIHANHPSLRINGCFENRGAACSNSSVLLLVLLSFL